MNGPVQGSGITRSALLTVVVVLAVLRLAQDVFIPLALAILLTFLLAPMVESLVRWHINRVVSVVASMILAFAVIGALGDLVFNQFADLAHEFPSYQRQFRTNLTHWSGALQVGVAETTKAFEELTREIERVTPSDPKPRGVPKVQIVTPGPSALDTVRQILGPFVRPVGTTFAVIVLVTFMLLKLPDLRERLVRLLGARNLHLTTEALGDAAGRVSRYLLMQILINGWTGLWVGVGLFFLGVPNAVLWGALTLILRFIPYVGIVMAQAIPLVLSFAVFDAWTKPVEVLALFGVLELFNYTVLEPWLYGTRTGVSPVALLLAAAFWAWMWGLAGLFLAVPMTVCVVVMGKYIPQLQFLEVLLGDEPVLKPHERLYQRLLSSNRDQADVVLQAALRESAMIEVCDQFILPAMLRVEEDHDRGTLTSERRQVVLEHINQWVDERLDSLEDADPRAGGSGALRERSGQFSVGMQAPVLCVPASDRADEIIAKLLAAALFEHGFTARVSDPRDALEGLLDGPPAVGAIVISALPPEAVTPARAVCKRVGAVGAKVPIVVGLWRAEGDLERARQRLSSAGATRTVTTFVDCLLALEARNPVETAELAGDLGAADEPAAGRPTPSELASTDL